MKTSAGLLMYRRAASSIEVFLVHPGGPFFQRKDRGAWTIPKGEVGPEEAPLAAARREFTEETGLPVPAGDLLPLGEVRQRGGKRVLAWAFEGDCDPEAIESNVFEMEWPPRSGRSRSFPEIDRAAFFTPDAARERVNPAQAVLVDRLLQAVSAKAPGGSVDDRGA